MSYLNFALEITALPDGTYRLRVESPVGEASANVPSPFTTEEIDRYLKVLGREQSVPRAELTRTAREFGDRLFTFAFRSSPDISNAYFASLRDAGSADGLRIRLSIDGAGALSQLPWEYLRDPSQDFLALSRRTPVVRYTPQLDVRPPAAITLPLRVLVMISAPEDFPALDVEGEWARLQEATAPLQARGLIALERLDTATLIALQRRLREADYHIFHYIGHSDYDANSQQGLIVFENEQDNRRAQIIPAANLSRELGEESTVRLVVLNSCQSAHRSSADVFAGAASSLVARGIPAVVAMQFAISDGAAKAFAEEFYRALAEMLPLEPAVSEARRAIANRVQNNEWATPVLYLRAESGVLFQTAALTAATRPAMSPVSSTPVSTAPMSQRPPVGWLLLFGGVAVAAIVLLLLAMSRFIFPPIPTPTAAAALLPDLTVGNMRVAPRAPAPGQIFILSITITNAGQVDSGGFNWTWDASVANPELRNSLDGHIDNVPPGASRNISFPFSYGWWGTYSSQLNVDADTQVEESDNRNNSRSFEIEIARLPFAVDFSLLPSNQLVEPPMPLDPEQFALWNLAFTLDAPANSGCDAGALQLIDQRGDIVLTTSDPANCANLPLSATILRGPVAAVAAEIIPQADGSATFRYYSDAEGQRLIFQSPPVALRAGVVTTLTAGDDTPRQIRRIEISVPGQNVQLTRLVLTPENP